VPINRLLEGAVIQPDQIDTVVSAYEGCLKAIGLVDRTDPVTEIVARKIIEVVQRGETDPHRICERTMMELGIPPRVH
jgi:hypothetical protein